MNSGNIFRFQNYQINILCFIVDQRVTKRKLRSKTEELPVETSLIIDEVITETPRRAKRAKLLVPDDRKAFFAIVSLMIDFNTVPADIKLSHENWCNYLPREKVDYIDRLKW